MDSGIMGYLRVWERLTFITVLIFRASLSKVKPAVRDATFMLMGPTTSEIYQTILHVEWVSTAMSMDSNMMGIGSTIFPMVREQKLTHQGKYIKGSSSWGRSLERESIGGRTEANT